MTREELLAAASELNTIDLVWFCERLAVVMEARDDVKDKEWIIWREGSNAANQHMTSKRVARVMAPTEELALEAARRHVTCYYNQRLWARLASDPEEASADGDGVYAIVYD